MKDYIKYHVSNPINFLSLLIDKKVLFVFGDSWTNNLYIQNEKLHWCYLLKEKLGYDIVVNVSSNYDSNYQIFDAVKKLFSQEEYPMKRQEYLNELKEYKVIIEWSTPMRDSTTVAEMYQPYNLSTIPNLNSNEINTQLWMKYVNDWFRVEMYSYDTQKRILFLQEFFNHNKIDWYGFMGFTPLVEKEFEGSRYDLRKFIDNGKFLFLYEFPNNMQDYLLREVEKEFSDYIGINEMQFENDRKPYFQKHNQVFTHDGHPNVDGLKMMSNILHKKIL